MAQERPGSTLQLDEGLTRRIEECARLRGISARELIDQFLRDYIAGQATAPRTSSPRNLSELAQSIASRVPDSEWAKLPSDLSMNFDHHAYGYPHED